MATAADHLTAFVDRVPGLDRVARAVAGESLARFRGRVLLERAAYLMVATDRTLLDIAVDSGFAGHADFARAFRREHGVLPSAWRAEPTSYVVDAPNDVHFHPRAGLVLPARQRMDGVDLVVEMAEHHVRAVGELVDRALALPDEDLDRPCPATAAGDDTTLRTSLSRLVDELEALPAAVHDRDVAPRPREPVTSMRERLDRVGPDLVDTVSLLAATGRFDEAVVDAFSPAPQVLSYGAMVARVLTSGTRHRVVAQLRDRGVTDVGSHPGER